MIGQGAKTAAIEDNRAPQGILGGFQLTDDLLHADQGIFLLQDIMKVDFNRSEQVK
jgi:hypothetical protein